MDFCTEFPRLESAQQERFRTVVTRLLAGEVLTPGGALRPDPDWRFAERFRELIDGYLQLGGWRFELDPGLRLARAVHTQGAMRVRFNKLESLVLCVLRLAYHEQMQQMSQEERFVLQVGQLRERIIQSGRSQVGLHRRQITQTVRRLARHSLVEVERGFLGEDDEPITVLPLIEKVLPADRIAELAERIRAYTARPSGEAEDASEETDAPEEVAE